MFSSYEPELFPGLIYRMIKPKIVLLIFVSGKIVLTGAKVREEIYQAFEMIYPVLQGNLILDSLTGASTDLDRLPQSLTTVKQCITNPYNPIRLVYYLFLTALRTFSSIQSIATMSLANSGCTWCAYRLLYLLLMHALPYLHAKTEFGQDIKNLLTLHASLLLITHTSLESRTAVSCAGRRTPPECNRRTENADIHFLCCSKRERRYQIEKDWSGRCGQESYRWLAYHACSWGLTTCPLRVRL